MLEFTLERNFSEIERIIDEEDWYKIFYNKRSIVSQEYYNFYYSYGNSWKPESILEIGVRFGYSAVSLAVGAGNSLKKFVGIDLEIDVNSSSNIAQKNLQAYTQAEVKLFNFNTQKDILPDDFGTFELIHIDADHTFYGCINDILLALSLSNAGTKIVVDDCLYAPVRAAAEAIIKIYHTKLNFKYVTNFRGHGLIETLDSFPELISKEKRYEIINQIESPFPEVIFSSIANNYSKISSQINQQECIENNHLPNNFLDAITQIKIQADLYLEEAIQKIKLALAFYQKNGFYVEDIFKTLGLIELGQNNRNNISKSFVKKNFVKEDHIQDINICKEIYSNLYLLNLLRLQLVNSSVGKCFTYFCRESTKHFDYLAVRIDKKLNGFNVPKQIAEFESAKQSQNNISVTYEGHLLIIVLTDALINILSCFEGELESQYWMQYWDIETNITWKRLIKSATSNFSDVPTPFPVKRPVEYEDFYKLQNIYNAGGIRITNITNIHHTITEKEEIDIVHPTDHAFRLFNTVYQIKLILKFLQERHPGETIKWLDVGCGIGFISNRIHFDGIVVGIDVAESLVEYANATKLTENHKYITGNFNDARNIIGGEKFHLITANEVIEHIFDPLEFISEMSQHTCDLIYASSPLMEQVPYLPAAEHLWSFTLDSYIRLFEESGMKITYSGILNVGKHLGQGNNWLSVAATIKEPFRVLPFT